MQAIEVTNMRTQAIVIAGIGTVNAESVKSGFVETTEFDADFYAYKDRCPAFGVLIQDPNDAFTPTGLQEVAAAATVADTSRVISAANTTEAGYALTLMAAGAVPAGTILYFTFTGGDDAVTITAAGADAIGAGTTLALNTANPIRRLQSNGAALWTAV